MWVREGREGEGEGVPAVGGLEKDEGDVQQGADERRNHMQRFLPSTPSLLSNLCAISSQLNASSFAVTTAWHHYNPSPYLLSRERTRRNRTCPLAHPPLRPRLAAPEHPSLLEQLRATEEVSAGMTSCG